METYKAKKERTSEDIHLEVGDFEEADASSAEVKNYLEKGYPQEWLSKVRGIRMVPFELDVAEEYNLKDGQGKSKSKALANVVGRGELGGSTLSFSQDIKNFFSAASHELGHANDWLGRTDLPDEYRIKLLYNVIKRVESPDRFNSAYVESISNQEPEKQLMYKATEYWAEIVGEYLDHPKEAKTRLAPADITLIEQHLKVTAANFDPEKAVIAREARKKIIKQTVAEKQIKIAAALNHLPDTETLLVAIKKWTAAENRLATIVEENENLDLDEEAILADIFTRGHKKWIKADKIFLNALDYLTALSAIYYGQDYGSDSKQTIKNYVEDYTKQMKKLDQEIKKFSSTEQEKIKKFHQYLEEALREAEVLPGSVLTEQYYE